MITRFACAVAVLFILSVPSGLRAQGQDSSSWLSVRQDSLLIQGQAVDQSLLPTITHYLRRAKDTIEVFFRTQYPTHIVVRVFPDRKSLTEFWRQAWGAPEFQPACWMIASGTASLLALLSPRVWNTEACEHDPTDSVGTYRLITHEMVHVFHGQLNPRAEFDGLDSIAWFVEGLATYASGQLEGAHRQRLQEAVRRRQLPEQLRDVWTGPYRYALAGSLVEYIDTRHGRDRLIAMLGCTSQEALLTALQTSENHLLLRWRETLDAAGP